MKQISDLDTDHCTLARSAWIASGLMVVLAMLLVPRGAEAATSGNAVGVGRVDWSASERPTRWAYQASYPSTQACQHGEGRRYEVGPDQPYANPRDVPWLDLLPCDEVLIHYRPQPYTDMVFVASRGAPRKWITIRGVPGPRGERPVFSGVHAVMPAATGANRWTQSAALLTVARPDPGVAPVGAYYKPGFLHITGLTFRGARAPAPITDIQGKPAVWGEFAAGISATGVEHLAVTDCEFDSNGLGLFVNSTNGETMQSRDLLVAHNYFHDNGVVNQASQHNAYTEAIGTVYEYNYFGAPIRGMGGDNIKERSAGIVFRYNYVQDGTFLLGLQDPDSNKELESVEEDAWGEKLVASAFVYGNTFVVTRPTVYDNAPPAIVQHGNGGVVADWNKQIREGTLYFYGNQVISKLDPAWGWTSEGKVPYALTLFLMSNTRSPTLVDARNNLFYGARADTSCSWWKHCEAMPFALFGLQGRAHWEQNWITAYRYSAARKPDGAYNMGEPFKGDGLGGLRAEKAGADPGFVDFKAGNYAARPGAPMTRLKAPMPPAVRLRKLESTSASVLRPFGAPGVF